MRLAATHMPRHDRLIRAADAAALAVDAGLRALWRDLLRAVRGSRSPAHAHAATLAVLKRVPGVVAAGLRQQFARLYAAGRRAALATVRDSVHEARRSRLPGHAGAGSHELPEARVRGNAAPYGLFGLAASPASYASPGGTTIRDRHLREEVGHDPLDLLPPQSRAEALRLLGQFVRPADFALIGTDTDRRMPEVLAHLIATSVSAGDTQQETAAKLRPFFDGSRVRAKRSARTFGLHVAHAAQMTAWEELGDAVIGYELLSVRSEHTRPWHAARHGTTYYKDPGPGQKGLRQMPRPPLEPDDPGERPPGAPRVAWNCLCALIPVIA